MTEMVALAIGIMLGCCALGAGIAMIAGMIMGCAIAETTGIYALVIAILLILMVPQQFVNILMNAIG